MPRLDDPQYVAAEYADERRLLGRTELWRASSGPRPYFTAVERIDVEERFSVTEAAPRAYLRSTRFAALADNVPDLPDGLSVTAAGSVFIATN